MLGKLISESSLNNCCTDTENESVCGNGTNEKFIRKAAVESPESPKSSGFTDKLMD